MSSSSYHSFPQDSSADRFDPFHSYYSSPNVPGLSTMSSYASANSTNPTRSYGISSPDIRINTSTAHRPGVSSYVQTQPPTVWHPYTLPHNPAEASTTSMYSTPRSPGPNQYPVYYPSGQNSSMYQQSGHISPFSDFLLSPTYPPTLQLSPQTPHSSPSTPSSHGDFYFRSSSNGESPSISPSSLGGRRAADTTENRVYTHREQVQFFKDAFYSAIAGYSGPFVPQVMYKPHTNSDRRRYVEEVGLEAPIKFWVDNPNECGIPLSDALHSRVKRLLNRDEPVFRDRGPSVSIRLEWPGYRQWSRQIPTKDFRSPPGPITRAKLAKNIGKCILRFIQEKERVNMEDDADGRWRVGSGYIGVDDLILVSLHHVSMGSWQPQLRLKRALPS